MRQVASPSRSGAAAAFTVPGGVAGFSQVVAITGGTSYTFSGYVLTDHPAVVGVLLRLSWYASADGTGPTLLVSDAQPITGAAAEYRPITVTALAPTAARSVRTAVVVEVAGAEAATVFCDDVTFAIAPATLPATATTSATPTPFATRPPSGGGGRAPAPAPTPTRTVTATRTPTPTRTPTTTRTPPPTGTPTATPAPPWAIVINEVLYDPVGPGVEAAGEWAELLNRTEQPILLAGWTLADNVEADPLPPYTLEPGGVVVVAGRSGAAALSIRMLSTQVDVLVPADGTLGNGLRNPGDRLILRDGTGRMIDGLSWGDDTSVFNPALPTVAPGHSLERRPAGSVGRGAADFTDNPQPSPGRGLPPAPTATSTPTITPEAARVRLLIHEVMYDPAGPEREATLEWVELYNPEPVPVSPQGWTLEDNHGQDELTGPALPPGGVLVVAAERAAFLAAWPAFRGTVVEVADRTLGNGLANTGDRLVLRDALGRVSDALSWGSDATILDPPCSQVAEGHSLERHPAGHQAPGCALLDNPRPSPGERLGAATPTPTPVPSATPPTIIPTPTPAPVAAPLPSVTTTAMPAPTPTRTPAPVPDTAATGAAAATLPPTAQATAIPVVDRSPVPPVLPLSPLPEPPRPLLEATAGAGPTTEAAGTLDSVPRIRYAEEPPPAQEGASLTSWHSVGRVIGAVVTLLGGVLLVWQLTRVWRR
ncbi:MAG: lamin tail domain-containing protein [Chloroflexi bacterium]|nr:lamin tail domain-containing protein [Chloroflexota bacterium]